MFPRTISICLFATAQICAQGWKPWPCKAAWTQSVSGTTKDRAFANIHWTLPGLGLVELMPGSGLKKGHPVVMVRIAGKTLRVGSLEESPNVIGNNLGGLEWPESLNMIGEPNAPELEIIKSKGWVLFRMTWGTTYQGYTPSGLLLLAWRQDSRSWQAFGCLGDEIKLRSVNPSALGFEAKGAVRVFPSRDYKKWSQRITLGTTKDEMTLSLGPLRLNPLK